ncbi:MAG TPA: VIT and VWA domain-containing protein, partial [Blastocatellia bacterium]
MSARPGAPLLLLLLCVFPGLFALLDRAGASAQTIAANDKVTQGQLRIVDAHGKPGELCPLKHTGVKAEVSGFLARVTLTQEFHNPRDEKVEAVYLFPLPQRSAVDQLTMDVDGRLIRGEIKRREEAQQLFAQARKEGRVAALLDQERPNLFTQSVTNIAPGATIKVSISYVETLPYEDGVYEFAFPMVEGQRYIPGEAKPDNGEEITAGTDQVPDAARITAPRMPTGMRPGHDISLEIAIDTGVPLEQISSESHDVEIDRDGNHQAVVRLKEKDAIPDRDFTLRFGVGGQRIADAVLAHRDERGGYFTLMLQPPNRVAAEDVTPKELVFVVDTSGSMAGLPIETAKRLMRLALDGLYEHDSFNLITFAGNTKILFDKPVPATRENLRKAMKFLEEMQGDGGTEMMKAIRAALADTGAQDHIRIVCFLTDGEVGNDMEIISEAQRHPNARIFSFGIGHSVNRFLLDKIAEQGRGEAEYVYLTRSDEKAAAAAAKRFYERIRSPLLTDISVDWNGLPVEDVYPKRLPDLFSAKPLFITGRYTGAASGVIRLRGKAAGADFLLEIHGDLPEAAARHDALASLWARTRIDALMAQDYAGLQSGKVQKDIEEEITRLGLDYRLMTQFTSFIAVDEIVTAPGEAPQRVAVPVAAPNTTAIVATAGVHNMAVTISSSAQMIDTSSVGISTTVEHRRLDESPLNTRQPAELAKLAPGAAPTCVMSPVGLRARPEPVINDNSLSITLDGVDLANDVTGGTLSTPPIGAVSEFSVTTFGVKEDPARYSGGAVK